MLETFIPPSALQIGFYGLGLYSMQSSIDAVINSFDTIAPEVDSSRAVEPLDRVQPDIAEPETPPLNLLFGGHK